MLFAKVENGVTEFSTKTAEKEVPRTGSAARAALSVSAGENLE
mgnify:FL=1